MKNDDFSPGIPQVNDEALNSLFDQIRERMAQEDEAQNPGFSDSGFTPYFRTRTPERSLPSADKHAPHTAPPEPDWLAYEESLRLLLEADGNVAQDTPQDEDLMPEAAAVQPPSQPTVLPAVPPPPLTETLTQAPPPENPPESMEPRILQWDLPEEAAKLAEASPEQEEPPEPEVLPEPEELPEVPAAIEAALPLPAAAPQKAPRKKRLTRHLLQAAVLALMGSLLVGCLLLLACGNRTNRSLFGIYLISANTREMADTPQTRERGLQGGFDYGALLVVRPAKPDELKPNDIIAVRASNAPGSLLIVSRFVRVQAQGNAENGEEKTAVLICCDDLQPQNERSHSPQNLVGIKTAAVPFAGQALESLQQRRPLALLFVCALGGSLLLLALYFYLPNKDKKPTHEKK